MSNWVEYRDLLENFNSTVNSLDNPDEKVMYDIMRHFIDIVVLSKLFFGSGEYLPFLQQIGSRITLIIHRSAVRRNNNKNTQEKWEENFNTKILTKFDSKKSY